MISRFALPTPLQERLRKAASSFAALHAANSVINMGYTFAQLFVFARTLEPHRYSEIILLTALSFYVLPMSQAVGRANFVALRGDAVGGEAIRSANETVTALYAHGVLLLMMAIAAPFLLQSSSGGEHILESFFYLFVCFGNNLWHYDVQSTVWALDSGKMFGRLMLIRRFAMFGALLVLWFTGSFLTFVIVVSSLTLLFFVLLARELRRTPTIMRLVPDIRLVSRERISHYLQLFWPALLSSLTELIVLNSPYALFAATFGTGPALVAYDTIMKVARATGTVARNLSEVALPRLSRMVVLGDRTAVGHLLGLVFCLCLLEGLAVAALLLFAGPSIFRFLLGPNDVLPAGIQHVAACIVLAACAYQPAMYFLSYNKAGRLIRQLTFASVAGIAVFAALMLMNVAGLMTALWLYAVYFCLVTVVAGGLCLVLVRQIGSAVAYTEQPA